MRGDSDAFEGLFMEVAPVLYRTAFRMTKDAHQAEDLVQETSLKAFKAFRTFEQGTNFKAWVFRIMTNTLINQYRNQNKMKFVEWDDFEDPVSGGIQEELASLDDLESVVHDEVKQALESLSEEYRLVLLLNAVEGFSYKEIAQILEIPIGTVMSRLYRGRQMMQAKLKSFAQSNYRRISGA